MSLFHIVSFCSSILCAPPPQPFFILESSLALGSHIFLLLHEEMKNKKFMKSKKEISQNSNYEE
jgi:hypothetical protein